MCMGTWAIFEGFRKSGAFINMWTVCIYHNPDKFTECMYGWCGAMLQSCKPVGVHLNLHNRTYCAASTCALVLASSASSSCAFGTATTAAAAKTHGPRYKWVESLGFSPQRRIWSKCIPLEVASHLFSQVYKLLVSYLFLIATQWQWQARAYRVLC